MSTKAEVRYKIAFEYVDKGRYPDVYSGLIQNDERYWEGSYREGSNINWIHGQIRELHKQPLVRNIKLFKTILTWMEIHPQDFD